jgi:hypothetical protein
MSRTGHLTDDDLVLLYIRYYTGKAYVSDMARENGVTTNVLSLCFRGYLRKKARFKADAIIARRGLKRQIKRKNDGTRGFY